MKHKKDNWKRRELLAILLAWIRGGGNIIDALTAWAEVITGQVTPDDCVTLSAEAEFWPDQPRPALKELIEY